MATAAILSPPAEVISTTVKWWTGGQVRDHLAHCLDPDAALLKLGHDIAAGRAEARVSSAKDPRNGGRPVVYSEPPRIDADLWWRIMDLAPAIDIWAAPSLQLPRTGNEKAIDLVGLRFREDDARRVADEHGFCPPIVAKNRGGRNSRAHGVVVAKMTLDLLARDREHVLSLTGVQLEKALGAEYKRIEGVAPCSQNLGRIANGILEVVQSHIR